MKDHPVKMGPPAPVHDAVPAPARHVFGLLSCGGKGSERSRTGR